MTTPIPLERDRAFQNLLTLAEGGDLTGVQQWLLVNGVPTYRFGQVLCRAAKAGQESVVRYLLPLTGPPLSEPGVHDAALEYAAAQGHENLVRLLLPLSQPHNPESNALIWAAEGFHADCVTLLAEHIDTQRAWQVLEDRKQWRAMDMLALYVPESHRQTVLSRAPAGAMPRTQGLALALALKQTIEDRSAPISLPTKPRL